MSKRNTVQASILSALALTMLCLCSPVATAQTGTPNTNGAPLKGVDVKLGKNPGGGAAARTTTDENGNFTFPAVPAGKYTVIVEAPTDTDMKNGVVKFFNEARVSVRLNLPGGKKIEKDYDLKQKKVFEPATTDPTERSTSMTSEKLVPFIFESDGVTPLNGTIIKSRSNIKNNARTGNPN